MMSSVVFVLAAILILSEPTSSGDLCGGYPEKDPCLPGGTWDPVLKRCMGYDLLPCYQCYSGEYCKTIEDSIKCILNSTSGNPMYLAEYWTDKHLTVPEPCTSIPGHYRPAYQNDRYDDLEPHNILSPLRTAIEDLHLLTGNAETSGYSLVAGMGATMVIHAAVSVIAQRILENCQNSSHNCPNVVDVYVQAPYYSGYIDVVQHVPNARWNVSADVNSPFTIEILTYPNNPNGAKRSPLVGDSSRVIRDMVYYWPMYTEVDEKLNHSLMIFSSSKHGGLAGTRFGWGLVKDKEMAEEMIGVVNSLILCMSVDVQLRVLSGLQAVLGEANKTTSVFPFHEYGQQLIGNRFKQLSTILSSCPGISLTNQLSSTGGYAWISCSSDLGACVDVLERVNLRGLSGEFFGGTKNYVRLSMLLPSVEFDIMAVKIKTLCSELWLGGVRNELNRLKR